MDEMIREIRQDVKQLLVQSAVHNEILSEHKNFSVALQNEQKTIHAKLEPLQEHVSIMNKVLKGMGGLAIALIVQAIVRLLLR